MKHTKFIFIALFFFLSSTLSAQNFFFKLWDINYGDLMKNVEYKMDERLMSSGAGQNKNGDIHYLNKKYKDYFFEYIFLYSKNNRLDGIKVYIPCPSTEFYNELLAKFVEEYGNPTFNKQNDTRWDLHKNNPSEAIKFSLKEIYEGRYSIVISIFPYNNNLLAKEEYEESEDLAWGLKSNMLRNFVADKIKQDKGLELKGSDRIENVIFADEKMSNVQLSFSDMKLKGMYVSNHSMKRDSALIMHKNLKTKLISKYGTPSTVSNEKPIFYDEYYIPEILEMQEKKIKQYINDEIIFIKYENLEWIIGKKTIYLSSDFNSGLKTNSVRLEYKVIE